MDIEQKRQRILEKVNLYWEIEDKSINWDEILKDDDNVEKLYKYFLTKDKTERENLLEKYKEETIKEYGKSSEELHKLIWKAKNLVFQFKEKMENEKNEEDIKDIEDTLDNI
jgi:hypothetical protein